MPYLTPTPTIVNGRRHWFTRLRDFTRVGTCTYRVRHTGTGEVYEIFGGKLAGARSNEWWVNTPSWHKAVETTSLIDSLRMLEGM